MQINDILSRVKCFVLDMDGTFFLENRPLPGAMEFVHLLDQRRTPFIFLTNNSSKGKDQYVEKLRKMGVTTLRDDQVLTSGEATAIYLRKHYPESRLYVVGTQALQHELSEHGFTLAEDDPDVVVLGFDTSLTYEKIRKLCDLVRAGKPYIATHPDVNCPTEKGFMPDIGAMMALVEASTGIKPGVIVGKPFQPMVDALIEKVGVSAEEMAMVGDRLYTDIAMGETGMATILVLSGETKKGDLDGSPFRPDLVIENLAGLVTLLQVR